MLDRYAYVRNNPIKYVDPTGLSGWIPRFGTPADWEGFKKWAEALRGMGVPADKVPNLMRLITLFSRGSPGIGAISEATAFIGKGTGNYYIEWSAWKV